MYRKNKQKPDKLGILLKQGRKLFHTNDLALLWDITNKNTLYTTIKRYKKKGVLVPIHKGFYSTVPLSQLDPVEMGISYLHDYTYLSTESILVGAGVIAQGIPAITLVSTASKKFTVGEHEYRSRQMKPTFLYHQAGIRQKDNYYLATTERAVADLLYYNPSYYFDNPKAINWEEVGKIQKEVGFK